MPPVGLLMGKVDFSQLFIALNGEHYATLDEAIKASAPVIKYGQFINDTIAFIILGLVVFVL